MTAMPTIARPRSQSSPRRGVSPSNNGDKAKIQKADVYCRMMALPASVRVVARTKQMVITVKNTTQHVAAGRRDR